MQRRRVITIAVATAAVAFGLSAGQASSAGPGSAGRQPAHSSLVSAVSLPGAATPDEVAVAGASTVLGVSQTDAATLLEAQRAFGAVVNKLHDEYSDAVSSYRWNMTTGRGEVTLVLGADPAMRAAVTALALSVGADVRDGGEMTRKARAEQVVALAEAIRQAHPEVTTFRVRPAQDYRSLVVETPEAVSDAITHWVSEQPMPVDVEQVVIEGLSGSLSSGRQ